MSKIAWRHWVTLAPLDRALGAASLCGANDSRDRVVVDWKHQDRVTCPNCRKVLDAALATKPRGMP